MSAFEVAVNKSDLRKEFRSKRQAFTQRFQADEAIINNLKKVIDLHSAESLFSYRAFDGEVNIDDLISSDFHFAFPVIKDGEMEFYKVSKEEDWVKNSWGIFEPNPESCEKAADADIVFVPGVVFDHQGGRVGMGKAFYDRYLKNFKGLKVGVAYSLQMSEELIDIEAHDILMDYIVTENFILNVLEKRQ